MRAILAFVALAIGAFAMPANKRDLEIVVETVTDIVYVYDIVTVTADDGAVSSTTIVATTSTTIVVTTSSAAPSLASQQYNTPTESSTLAQSSSEPIFSILPIVPTSSVYAPPAPPSVVSSPYSTSIAPPLTSVSSPFIEPPVVQPTTRSVAPTTSTAVTTTSVAPSSTSSTTSETPAAVAPASTQRRLTSYNDLALAHHNIHRQNHSAPDLVWDINLANTASRIAETCIYAHNVDMDRGSIGGYGQNIAAGVSAANISVIITELFYNGELHWYDGLYGQAQPDMTDFEHWGHFSQIVWHDTTKVGCATSFCEDGLGNVGKNVAPYFTVCNYQGPGNVAGRYSQVGNSLGHETAHWDYFS